MKKEKISIAALKVKSFVTSFETSKGETMHVVGGAKNEASDGGGDIQTDSFSILTTFPSYVMYCQPDHGSYA